MLEREIIVPSMAKKSQHDIHITLHMSKQMEMKLFMKLKPRADQDGPIVCVNCSVFNALDLHTHKI
jgi:hypothetical protein